MAGERVPLVLVPRFTTYVGQTAFWTLPIDVQPYYAIDLTVWRGPLLGTGSTFTFLPMESVDRSHWVEVPGSSAEDPDADTETSYAWPLRTRWFRLHVALAGTSPGVTWWAQGYLLKREK